MAEAPTRAALEAGVLALGGGLGATVPGGGRGGGGLAVTPGGGNGGGGLAVTPAGGNGGGLADALDSATHVVAPAVLWGGWVPAAPVMYEIG